MIIIQTDCKRSYVSQHEQAIITNSLPLQYLAQVSSFTWVMVVNAQGNRRGYVQLTGVIVVPFRGRVKIRGPVLARVFESIMSTVRGSNILSGIKPENYSGNRNKF